MPLVGRVWRLKEATHEALQASEFAALLGYALSGRQTVSLLFENRRQAQGSCESAQVGRRPGPPRCRAGFARAVLIRNRLLHHPLQGNGLALRTWKNYECRLSRFHAFVGDEDIRQFTEDGMIDNVSEFLAQRLRHREVSDSKHDRTILSAFFAYTIARRWYRGNNPARRELHLLRKPRRKLRAPRRTTPAEDLIIREQACTLDIWPIVMLARWAGFRRGEATTLRWKNINFDEGYADIVGEEGGRKHPRRVWLAPWIVLQLRGHKASVCPKCDTFTIWPYHPDSASKRWNRFREAHLERKIGLHDLRASWVTEVHERGMTAMEESKIGGHSAAVAEKYYADFTAKAARSKLPPDPLSCREGDRETTPGMTAGEPLKTQMSH